MNNEMKTCKYCKEQINKSAKRCPKCGGKFGMPGFVKVLIILVIIFGVIVGCVSSCANGVNKAVEETKNSYKDVNGKTSFKLNEPFQNSYEKITMLEVNENFTDHSEYLKPASGNKYVAVKFEVENIKEDNDELYVSSLEFNIFADDVAGKETFVGNDKYKDVTATVGKGKKTVGYIIYEVPKTYDKLVIDYNPSFWTDGTSIEFVIK